MHTPDSNASYLPVDRGMTGLGLIMQLGGTLFATLTAMVGLSQIIVLSQMRSFGMGDTGLTGWLLLLTAMGVIRSLVHRVAGTELLYGQQPAQAIRRYLFVSASHTLGWLAFLVIKLDATPAGWLPVVTMFVAWPVILVVMLGRPALRLPVPDQHGQAAVPVGADRGFQGLGTLMLVFGLSGALFSGLMVSALSGARGAGPSGLIGLLILSVVFLVIRSLVHAHAGATLLGGEPSVDRVSAAAHRYANIGVISSVACGGVLLILMMSAGGGGVLLGMAMLIGLVAMLLLWPLAVRRLVQTRRMELLVESDRVPALGAAPDQGRTALGWLLLAFGGIGLAAALPAVLFSGQEMVDRHGVTQILAAFQQGADREPWLSLLVYGLQVWAGVELVLMTDRHRVIATLFGVTATVVTLYLTLPLFDHLGGLGLGRAGAGQIVFASVAIGLIIPVLTVILVNRNLPPPRLPVARVFE
jgi:hypothetical protein